MCLPVLQPGTGTLCATHPKTAALCSSSWCGDEADESQIAVSEGLRPDPLGIVNTAVRGRGVTTQFIDAF